MVDLPVLRNGELQFVLGDQFFTLLEDSVPVFLGQFVRSTRNDWLECIFIRFFFADELRFAQF